MERVRGCPRCDYDLAGQDQAAASVICPECGLDVVWAEWSAVNSRRSRRALESPIARPAIACVATTVRMFVPWRMWTSVRMSDPIRIKRLAWFLAVNLVAAWLILVFAGSGVARRFAYRAESTSFFNSPNSVQLFGPGGLPPPPVTPTPTRDQLAALGQSVWLHADWYFVPRNMPSRAAGDLQRWADSERLTVGTPAEVDAWLRAMSAATGTYVMLIDLESERAGRELAIRAAVNPVQLLNVLFSRSGVSPWLVLPVWTVAVVTIMMPAAFLLLPTTFKLAKVRRAHLLRAFAYTALVPVWLLAVAYGAAEAPLWLGHSMYAARFWIRAIALVMSCFAVLWYFGTWWAFLRIYLKFKAVFLPLVLLSTLCGLATAVAALVLFRFWLIPLADA